MAEIRNRVDGRGLIGAGVNPGMLGALSEKQGIKPPEAAPLVALKLLSGPSISEKSGPFLEAPPSSSAMSFSSAREGFLAKLAPALAGAAPSTRAEAAERALGRLLEQRQQMENKIKAAQQTRGLIPIPR